MLLKDEKTTIITFFSSTEKTFKIFHGRAVGLKNSSSMHLTERIPQQDTAKRSPSSTAPQTEYVRFTHAHHPRPPPTPTYLPTDTSSHASPTLYFRIFIVDLTLNLHPQNIYIGTTALFFSLSLSIYLSNYLSIYLSISLSLSYALVGKRGKYEIKQCRGSDLQYSEKGKWKEYGSGRAQRKEIIDNRQG